MHGREIHHDKSRREEHHADHSDPFHDSYLEGSEEELEDKAFLAYLDFGGLHTR